MHFQISTVASIASFTLLSIFITPASANTVLPWPADLPGWGHLEINPSAFADVINPEALDESGLLKMLPETYSTERENPAGPDEACTNPYDFPFTSSITGTLCLPDGTEYEDVVEGMFSPESAQLTTAFMVPHDDCYNTCRAACVLSLVLWPFCSKQSTQSCPL